MNLYYVIGGIIMGKIINKKQLNPPQILALGFGLLIIIGAFLLNLPIASKNGESIGFINALFTSSSCVCVTGLTVVNTAEHWTTFGHIVIISLIQMGGLGFMTMATIVALFLGKKISLKERLVIKEQLNQDSMSGLVKLTKYVIYSTFMIEILGAILLSTRLVPIYGVKTGVWYSIFHAISAFCNAGFDLFGDSLAPYVGDIVLNLTISALIIIGGLGFSVYIDISRKRSFKKLNLHSKLVIIISLSLLLIGTVSIFLIEYSNPGTLKYLSMKDKILASFFQSVISRTAGFYSVPLSKLHESTIFIMIILMFIGGSPGSTGGGIKTTTFGVLFLTTRAVAKGDEDVVVFKKTIPTETIHRALAIVSISMALILIVSLVLTLTEDANFIDILYESTSAFATVGVSRDLSPKLSEVGKVLIALTMYSGRVGPLTMALAFASKKKESNYKYSDGNVLVG